MTKKQKRHKFCCKKFAKEATSIQSSSGGGYLYPDEMQPITQFEKGKKKGWRERMKASIAKQTGGSHMRA